MTDVSTLLERFRASSELLAEATTGIASDEADFRPAAGAWCIRQVVCHLADAEAVAVMRLRQVLAEDNPVLPAFDGTVWAEKLDYAKRDIAQPLETFRRLRAENYQLLKDQPEEAFRRTGAHTESGVMTLHDLIKSNAEHVEEHVHEIRRARAAYFHRSGPS